MTHAKHGLLLINIGSPSAPTVSAVRRYLHEFLSDRRVIDLPAPLRYLLLYTCILPFRPRRSAQAYQAIWTSKGSPLIYHSEALRLTLQERLGEQYKVVLGMRYGQPNIPDALAQLQSCEHITVLPLYPQYSSAASGSAIEKVLRELAPKSIIPSITIIREFYQHPAFIRAQAAQIKPYIEKNHDHVLFSYHGLPERNQGNYQAQCVETSSLLANELGLINYSTSFQSRLGKTPWIKPYTDAMILDLAARGVKHLVIACPSFVTDCLETLEEIGIRENKRWVEAGGKKLTLIPCLNASEDWINAITKMILNKPN